MANSINRLTLFLVLVFSTLWLNSQNIKWTVWDTANSKIPDNIIKFVNADADDNIWFSTGDCFLGGVLVKFDGQNFQSWDEKNSGLSDRFITCVAFDKDKSLWVGTKSSGLFKFDGKVWKQFSKKDQCLPNDHVYSILIDGDILIVGTEGGIALRKNDQWNFLTHSNTPDLPHNHINHITKAIDGKYWISTEQGLAITSDFKSWKILNKENSALRDNLISNVTFDHKGNAWIVFWGGLALLQPDGKMQVFDETNSKLPPFSDYTVAVDNENIVWISSNFGLIRYDGKNWEVFTPQNSNFPDFFINKVITDSKGNVWCATQRGLAAFFRK